MYSLWPTWVYGGTSLSGTTAWRTTMSKSPVCLTTWNWKLAAPLIGTSKVWYTQSPGHTSPWYLPRVAGTWGEEGMHM